MQYQRFINDWIKNYRKCLKGKISEADVVHYADLFEDNFDLVFKFIKPILKYHRDNDANTSMYCDILMFDTSNEKCAWMLTIFQYI